MEDPEIDDGADTSFPDSDHDVIKVWITDGLVDTEHGPAIEFHLLLAGDYDMVPALFAVYESYRVGFKTTNVADGEEWYIDAKGSRDSMDAVVTSVPVGDESAACRFSRAPEGSYADIPDEERLEDLGLAQLIDGKQIVCQVPLDRLGGFDPAIDSVYDLWVEQRWVVRGPLSGGDEVGPEVIGTYDRAPDSGYGREYTLFGPSAPSAGIVYAELDVLPFSNSTETPTNGTWQFNHTGSGSFLVNASAERGSVALNVTGPDGLSFTDNGTRIEAAIDGCVDVCNMTFQFVFDGFVGTYSIEPAPVSINGQTGNVTGDPDAPGGTVGGDGNQTGNQTVGEDPSDKDSPSLAVPLAMLAVAVIAARRRRD